MIDSILGFFGGNAGDDCEQNAWTPWNDCTDYPLGITSGDIAQAWQIYTGHQSGLLQNPQQQTWLSGAYTQTWLMFGGVALVVWLMNRPNK